MNRAEQREKTSALVAEVHKVAKIGAGKLLQLLEDPDIRVGMGRGDLHPMVLNAITGTAIDKLAKYENWEKKGVGDAQDWVKALVSGLQQAGGGRVSLEVEPQRVPVEVKVLDVPRVSGLIEGSYHVNQRASLDDEALEKKRAGDRARQQKVRDRKRAEWEAEVSARDLSDP